MVLLRIRFRQYYIALHAFPRTIDLMSLKSRKRDQKLKKTADFRFFRFPFVTTLSHWYQGQFQPSSSELELKDLIFMQTRYKSFVGLR